MRNDIADYEGYSPACSTRGEGDAPRATRASGGLLALADEGLVERSIVVCRENRPRLERGIEIWPLEFFLAELWQDRL